RPGRRQTHDHRRVDRRGPRQGGPQACPDDRGRAEGHPDRPDRRRTPTAEEGREEVRRAEHSGGTRTPLLGNPCPPAPTAAARSSGGATPAARGPVRPPPSTAASGV